MQVKIVRFSSGFGNIPDTFLPYPADGWVETERSTESRLYELDSQYSLVEDDGRYYIVSDDGRVYDVYCEQGVVFIANFQDLQETHILGRWDACE